MAAAVPCESGLAQLDYRGTWYAFYIAANFPEVSLRSYCIVEPEPEPQPEREPETSAPTAVPE